MLSPNLIGKVIQCHIDMSDPTTFVVGRLIYYDDFWILMQDLSTSGHWNGLAMYLQSDLVAINTDTEYIRKLERLIEYWKEPLPETPVIIGNVLACILTYAYTSKHVVGLELFSSGFRDIDGVVSWISEDTIEIIQINEFGQPDGKSLLSIEAITRCYINDEESRCLEILR